MKRNAIRQQSKRALQRAVDLVGTKAELARRIGGNVQRQHVFNWLSKDAGPVPAEYCGAIEQATGGQVTRRDIRPDVFDRAA